MIAVRMTMPPIVGVPFFVRCRSGVSSRIVSPPCCSTRSRRISHGAIKSEMISAEISAMNERKVRYRKTLKTMWSLASGTRK